MDNSLNENSDNNNNNEQQKQQQSNDDVEQHLDNLNTLLEASNSAAVAVTNDDQVRIVIFIYFSKFIV